MPIDKVRISPSNATNVTDINPGERGADTEDDDDNEGSVGFCFAGNRV